MSFSRRAASYFRATAYSNKPWSSTFGITGKAARLDRRGRYGSRRECTLTVSALLCAFFTLFGAASNAGGLLDALDRTIDRLSLPEVEIVRTRYGIPHIRADNLNALAKGVGYTAAQDHLCLLADQFLRVASRRSEGLGANAADVAHPNIVSDLGLLALGIRRTANELYPKLTAQSRAMLEGYAAGYNAYLRDTPSWRRPSLCRDNKTVRPIDAQDLFAYHLLVAREASGVQFIPAAYFAAPPGAAVIEANGAAYDQNRYRLKPKLPWPKILKQLGSNAIALGRAHTQSGGMLLGTPHFPYYGHLRLHEYHIQIPGRLNARGVSLLGFPIPNIGFNEHVAWMHTVATSEHFIVYQLDLDPRDPTRYVVNGVSEPMSRRTESIRVQQADGSFVTLQKKVYRSRFGTLIEIPGKLDWTRRHAYALSDANEFIDGMIDQWLGYATAQSLDALVESARRWQSNPWSNTVAAGRDGRVFYADFSRVPALTAAAEFALKTDPRLAALRLEAGFTILPGTSAGGGLRPENQSLVEPRSAPHLERTDYVANFNNTPWLSNARAPLTGYGTLFGPAQSPLSPRAQRGFAIVDQLTRDKRPVELSDVYSLFFDNTSQLAQRILPDLLDLCAKSQDPALVEACAALRAWDGKFEAESRGAHLFREFAERFGSNPSYRHPFNAGSPFATPAGIDRGRKVEVLAQLKQAALALKRLGLKLDAPLNAVQFAPRYDHQGHIVSMPWAGGDTTVGTFNTADRDDPSFASLVPKPGYPIIDGATGLTAKGHQARFGTSYIQLVGFGRDGPRAFGLLTYSQSSHPDSPHYADQAELYARKQLRPLSLEWPSSGQSSFVGLEGGKGHEEFQPEIRRDQGR